MENSAQAISGLKDLIIALGHSINILLELAAAVAIFIFLWGMVTFLFKSGDEKSQEAGRNRMLWGVIALFVMVSVWGLVRFIGVALGLEVYISPDPGLQNPIPNNNQICTQDPVIGQICNPAR
ncbi:pilin [Candidatus Parcubacteria bacterium]|nr:pilin [Candidatus Parcubacteria bacterium]